MAPQTAEEGGMFRRGTSATDDGVERSRIAVQERGRIDPWVNRAAIRR
jgi:hypothetical protein